MSKSLHLNSTCNVALQHTTLVLATKFHNFRWLLFHYTTATHTSIWVCARARVHAWPVGVGVLNVATSVSSDMYPRPDFILSVFCIELHLSSRNDDGFKSNKSSPGFFSSTALPLAHALVLNRWEMYVTLRNLSQIRLRFRSRIKPSNNKKKKKLVRFHLRLLRLAYFAGPFCSTIMGQHINLLLSFIPWTFLTMWIFNARRPADWL